MKARQRIGLIRRNFKCINDQIFILLYKSLVRPLLEYANTVWAPTYKKDSECLERVQRRETKLVPRLKHMSYPTRLAELRLPTLIYKRRADMIQVYRILSGMDNLDKNKFFGLDGNKQTRGNQFKLYKPRFESNIKARSFSMIGMHCQTKWLLQKI